MFSKTSSRLVRRASRGFHRTPKWRTGKGEQKKKVTLPEEPKHCCMSGCENCVWIKYAQELAQSFEDGDVIAKQKITEKVRDPQLRAFLFTRLGLNETNGKN